MKLFKRKAKLIVSCYQLEDIKGNSAGMIRWDKEDKDYKYKGPQEFNITQEEVQEISKSLSFLNEKDSSDA